MATANDFFASSYEWIVANLGKIIVFTITFIVIFLLYKVLTGQISKLHSQQKLEENIAFALKRVFRWLAILVILAVFFAQFGIDVGLVAGLFAVAGGTIIGFAAMNTIGNAIAGIIVMTSRPFKIGDRIFFNNQFADVVAIDLIYTRMRTLDNVMVSIPNQELLKSEIDNYGKKRIIRRKCQIGVGYEVSSELVERALLDAANQSDAILNDPKPYVYVTKFGAYAVEYTLYVFTNRITRLSEIDSKLKRTVLETCKRFKIDISTPRLIRQIENNSPSLDDENLK